MNVLQNLTLFYDLQSPDSTYRNVCRGILDHMEEAADCSVYDLAELTNSSRTTIWRMIQKLGYESYSDFHHELKQAVKKYTYYNRILPEKDRKTVQDVKDIFLRQMEDARDRMRDTLTVEDLERVATQLNYADRVCFYTPFQSSAIHSLQQNLSISGIDTAYFSLMTEILEDAKQLTEHSIVFLNTIESTETMDVEKMFREVKKSGAKIFGISTGLSRYRHYVDEEVLKEPVVQVAEGVIVFESYFYMLSETYRLCYID